MYPAAVIYLTVSQRACVDMTRLATDRHDTYGRKQIVGTPWVGSQVHSGMAIGNHHYQLVAFEDWNPCRLVFGWIDLSNKDLVALTPV
jgi:hypothetical protein